MRLSTSFLFCVLPNIVTVTSSGLPPFSITLTSSQLFRRLHNDDIDHNDLFGGSGIAIPNIYIDAGKLLGSKLEIWTSDTLCSDIRIDDIIINYNKVSQTRIDLTLDIDDLDIQCDLDWRYKYWIFSGDGDAQIYASNSDASVTVTFASDDFNLYPPHSSTVTQCNSNINVKDLDFQGSVVSSILDQFEKSLRDNLENAMNDAICEELSSLNTSTLVAPLLQHNCVEDLILLSEFGLAPPDVSVGNFCTASMDPSTGASSFLCDYFSSDDDDGLYQSSCSSMFEGELVPLLTDLTCDSGLESRTMVPWCLPPSCLAEGIDVSIARKDAEAKAADGEGCTSTVTRYDLCEGERTKLESNGLTYEFPAALMADGSLQEYCTSTVDYYSSPITSDTECNLYNSTDIDELLSECTDSGGTVVTVTKNTVCDISGVLLDTVMLTTPWCIPAFCDVYQIYDERVLEENAAATCPTTITSPDLTAAPTSALSSPPTGHLTAAPSAQFTQSPTLPPTTAPSSPPTIFSPTDTPSHPHTPSPSRSHTQTPTLSPTAQPSPSPSHSPSYSPTTSKPALMPTSSPTLMPTPTPTEFVCVDDPTFRHQDKEKKSCRWIGKKKNRTNVLCRKKKVFNACKIVCNRCCADDLTRKFTVEGDETQEHTCGWLRSETRKRDQCTRHRVNSICARKCGRCCSNDRDFQFDTGTTTANPKPRTCGWLKKKPKRARVWCRREPSIAEACQRSCDSCEDYTIPIPV